MRLFVLAFFFSLAISINAPASAQNSLLLQAIKSDIGKTAEMIRKEHNGITYIALPAPKHKKFDVPIVDGPTAMATLIKAMDMLEGKKSFTSSQINKLKRHGHITIVYDPRYPDKRASMSSVQVALFSPHFFGRVESRMKGRNFLVIVSRHGIKWPLKEMAAVMVHELVGHGIQHLNNRWNKMRLIDMECEAWLYEEMAYQDMGIDKFSKEMITFKKQLAQQCDGFLRHLRNKNPAGNALWEKLNPVVPKLLVHFHKYLKNIKKKSRLGLPVSTSG